MNPADVAQSVLPLTQVDVVPIVILSKIFVTFFATILAVYLIKFLPINRRINLIVRVIVLIIGVLSLLSFRFTALQQPNVDFVRRGRALSVRAASEKDFSEMTKGAKQAPKFDADKIAALLDKRDPQRNAAAGTTPTPLDQHTAENEGSPSVPEVTFTHMGGMFNNEVIGGPPKTKLSQSEIDALRARLMSLWKPPVGAQDADQFQVTIRIRFKRDGTLDIGPQVLTSGSGARFNAIRDSAVRAVLVGQPYTMLRPDHYDTWKEIDFTFDTREMFNNIPAR